jgi:hypothetical protein
MSEKVSNSSSSSSSSFSDSVTAFPKDEAIEMKETKETNETATEPKKDLENQKTEGTPTSI